MRSGGSEVLAHRDADHYTYIPVENTIIVWREIGIGMFKMELRSLDAIHLAVASSEGLTLLTSDRGLFKSARALAQDASCWKDSARIHNSKLIMITYLRLNQF